MVLLASTSPEGQPGAAEAVTPHHHSSYLPSAPPSPANKKIFSSLKQSHRLLHSYEKY